MNFILFIIYLLYISIIYIISIPLFISILFIHYLNNAIQLIFNYTVRSKISRDTAHKNKMEIKIFFKAFAFILKKNYNYDIEFQLFQRPSHSLLHIHNKPKHHNSTQYAIDIVAACLQSEATPMHTHAP